MGLVIVVLRAPFGGFDALADPIGWGLVAAGLLPLRGRLPFGGSVLAAAAVAGVVSVPLWLPVVDDLLDASGQWAVSLPQTLCCLMLCASLTAVVSGPRRRWFSALRWLFGVVALGPVLVYGGHVDALATPLAVLAVLANVALIYQLFAVSTRPELQGPRTGPSSGPPSGPSGDPPGFDLWTDQSPSR